jgi:hypothetical protein
MAMSKHTPTPWKVVTEHHFANGYFYTSIQPVEVADGALEHLRMANGEHHVCRMSHTALHRKFDLHRADAEFIVKAANAYGDLLAALRGFVDGFDPDKDYDATDIAYVRFAEKATVALAAIAKAEGRP